jgi:hypothetical protein
VLGLRIGFGSVGETGVTAVNKYLILSAAAVFAGTASASAGKHCFTFGSAAGSAYCDDAIVYTGVDGGALSGAVWVWSHGYCNGMVSEGQGLLAKTAALGKIADMSDNYEAMGGIYSVQLNYTLPKKLKNGQPWTLWVGFNGTTSFESNAGVLSNVTKCQDRAVTHGHRSTLSSVKEIIQAYRNAQKS